MRLGGSFFRGSELSRLAVMAFLMIAGWAGAYVLYSQRGVPRSRPAPTVAQLSPLPPAESSLEFQSVQDRRTFSLRDNAAYAELLRRAREVPFEKLDRASRRDVRFSQLIEAPERYRGLPIHVEGTARRVTRQPVPDSHIFKSSVYYEAYVLTADSGNHPWCLVFENAPAELTIGDDLEQRMVFDGYFLKLAAYTDGADVVRVLPVLIGRFPPRPDSGPVPARRGTSPFPWVFAFLGVFTIYIGVRLFLQLRRSLRAATPSWRPPQVTDQIDPDRLAEWIEQAPDDPAADSDDLFPGTAGPS